MLKRVKLKTCVVLGRREARTVEDIRAALVDSEAGNLPVGLAPTVVKGHENGDNSLNADSTSIIEEEDVDAHEDSA